MTQSQNSSAKMALSVDEFNSNYYQNLGIKAVNSWNKLETVLEKSFDAFFFIGSTFYFRMFNKIIDDLIPTGVMNHLIENHYTKKFRKIENDETEPKVLNYDDLSFGFNIWLGFCLISLVGFIAEHIYKLIRTKKIKFAKVHPVLEGTLESFRILSPELIEKFRIKKHSQNELVSSTETEIDDITECAADDTSEHAMEFILINTLNIFPMQRLYFHTDSAWTTISQTLH